MTIQKITVARQLNSFFDGKYQGAKQQQGNSLPCYISAFPDKSGSMINTGIVTVKFDIESSPFTLPEVTMPVVMSGMVRFPLAINQKGFAMAFDVYTGGVSGLGGGTANLTQCGNLSGMVFVPIGNTQFDKVKADLFTVLTAISDNAYKTTPTQLHDNGELMRAKINECAAALSLTPLAGTVKLAVAI
jgi:hypothetical protein